MSLDAASLKKLKVVELREMLSARGLSTTGLKDVLVERLAASMVPAAAEPAAQPETTIAPPEPTAPPASQSKVTVAAAFVSNVVEARPAAAATEKPAQQSATTSTQPQDVVMLDVDSSIARTHSAVEITSSAAEVVSAEEERPGKRVKSNTLNLTVKDILSDSLTQMANQYWGPGNDKLKPFESNVVESIYSNEIHPSKGKSSTTRLLLLEFSCYLENYLWKNFNPKSFTHAHIMSIILMVNEKFRQGVPVWTIFQSRPDVFPEFVNAIFQLFASLSSVHEKVVYITFLTHLYQSLEDAVVRRVALKMVSIALWTSVGQNRLKEISRETPEYEAPLAAALKSRGGLECTFFPALIRDFQQQLVRFEQNADDVDDDESNLQYLNRTLVLLIDLLAQLPTRRFFRVLLEDMHFYTKCQLSGLSKAAAAVAPSDEVDTAMTQVKLFGQLLKMLQFYLRFEIDESSGAALNDTEVMSQHYAFMQKLQRIAFRYFKDDCPDLCLKSIASLDSRQALQQLLTTLSHDQLVVLMQQLGLTVSDEHQSDEFLIEVLINSTERRQSQKQAVNETPLFPDEKVLFDRNLVPEENSGDLVLALPKLNLQFLTLHDYMLRNFQLYRLESTYQIREDLVKACERIQPKLNRHNKTVFTGWSRMAVPIDRVAVTQVRKPRLGDKMPALVQAEVVVDLGAFSGAVREEWESIRKHDTLFVLTMAGNEYYTPPSDLLDDGAEEMDEDRQALEAKIAYEDALKMRAAYGGRGREWRDFTFGRGRTTRRGRATSSYGRGVDQNSRDAASLSNDGVSGATAASLGIQHLRGGEVLEILDENLCVVGQMNEDGNMHKAMGDIRTFRIALDTAQYQLDQEYLLANENASDLYSTFNLLVRRSAKENNFKAVLSTIRDLMNTEFSVPDWLHDSLLGYGDPHASKYYNLPSRLPTVDFADTFLDLEHVKSSFPCHRIEVGQAALPPFRLSFPDDAGAPDYEKLASAALAQAAGQTSSTASAADLPRVLVESYTPAMPRHGAFPRLNHVRYTPTQVEAIRSGSQPGLTMVVGPPGTGKTDVAVQIIVNLYRQFPEQRTILIAHSNQALNDLFEKLMQRDIDERHLLRLGHGEKDIAGDKDFTKFGRVNYMLQRRLECLQHIAALAKSLGMSEDSASTCETAGHFRLYAIAARWEKFVLQCQAADGQIDAVSKNFPFTAFLSYLGMGEGTPYAFTNTANDMNIAKFVYSRIESIFEETEQCRPFELLRSFRDRGDLLLTRHAKIIAMTCTHAALKRADLVKLGFQYDNVIMEEAAQVMEIETFVPMLLQTMDKEGGHRLKRVVLIGDHHQLPPVVKNRAFQQYSHLDQSMFTRLVRLGTPTITLNLQGRARPAISSLYRWRYQQLGDLPSVTSLPQYRNANAGFAFEMQLIDVGDYNGRGETAPVPHFYQNLGEAEYVVQTFMLMRLLGYPAEKISIITSYNGQKFLIRDVIERRCGHNPLFGRPARITTVDKFQGQQNDYVLLSLVRTRAVGHMRDIRRLVVAMSRARLGLYVFGRAALFQNCYELSPAFMQLSKQPLKLHIVPGEAWPTTRDVSAKVDSMVIEDVVHMGRVVDQMARLTLQHLRNQSRDSRAADMKALEQQQRADAVAEQQKHAEHGTEQALSAIDIASMHAVATAADMAQLSDNESDDDAQVL